jgi:hypothetical protein
VATWVEFLLEEALLCGLEGVVSSGATLGLRSLACAPSSPRAGSESERLADFKDEASPPPFRTSTMTKEARRELFRR